MIFGILLMKISFLHHSQMLTLSYYSHISHVITYPDLRQWIWRKKTRLDQNIFKDSLIKNSGETWASFASSKGQFISLFHINKHHKWQLTIARIYKILLLFHVSFTPIEAAAAAPNAQQYSNRTYSWHIWTSRGHITMTANAKFNTLFT